MLCNQAHEKRSPEINESEKGVPEYFGGRLPTFRHFLRPSLRDPTREIRVEGKKKDGTLAAAMGRGGRQTKKEEEEELRGAKRAFKEAQAEGCREEEARWANVIGDIHKRRGEYVEALRWLRIDYEVSVKHLPQRHLLPSCQSLGEVYLRLGRFSEALTYQVASHIPLLLSPHYLYHHSFQMLKAQSVKLCRIIIIIIIIRSHLS